MKKIAVLLMSYGTPQKTEDILPYYTHIRHNHAPSDAQYQELLGRYNAIGGTSPLAKITEAQAAQIAAYLKKYADGIDYQVYTGQRHIQPFIEETVDKIIADGHTEIRGIVLAPHGSTFINAYHGRAKEALVGTNITYKSYVGWWRQPSFISFWGDQIKAVLETSSGKNKFLFTAHSLPIKVLKNGDPYVEEVNQAAKAISDYAGKVDYEVAWQSAGRTEDEWIGPTVEEVTEKNIKAGYDQIIYLPFGFVADNLEVLYDNDVECRELVESLGAKYSRLTMPNDSLALAEAIGTRIQGDPTEIFN